MRFYDERGDACCNTGMTSQKNGLNDYLPNYLVEFKIILKEDN